MSELIAGIVGYRPSAEGTLHAVYVDRAGRQFVFDARGQRVHGLWFRPAYEADAPAPAEDTIRDTAGETTVEHPLRTSGVPSCFPSPGVHGSARL